MGMLGQLQHREQSRSIRTELPDWGSCRYWVCRVTPSSLQRLIDDRGFRLPMEAMASLTVAAVILWGRPPSDPGGGNGGGEERPAMVRSEIRSCSNSGINRRPESGNGNLDRIVQGHPWQGGTHHAKRCNRRQMNDRPWNTFCAVSFTRSRLHQRQRSEPSHRSHRSLEHGLP